MNQTLHVSTEYTTKREPVLNALDDAYGSTHTL